MHRCFTKTPMINKMNYPIHMPDPLHRSIRGGGIVKVGCSDFPIGRKAYQDRLNVVECSQFFTKSPQLRTIQNWRDTSPKNFEFVVCASQHITHPPTVAKTASHAFKKHAPSGQFRQNTTVAQAMQKTCHMARLLGSRLILFQLPTSMSPHPDHIGRMQDFFKQYRGTPHHFLWEPPFSWPDNLVDRLSQTLHISPVTNPLHKKRPHPFSVQYFRMGGPKRTSGIHSFSDKELENIVKACRTAKMTYVMFNNGPTSFKDALRFQSLLR